MNSQALTSVLIFVFVYALIIVDLLPRSIVTLGGAVVLFILGILKDTQVVSLINWEAMGLILGMFILVRVLVESGFFDVLGSYVIKISKGKPSIIFMSLAVTTGIMAAFMDSITVMLFMASLSMQVAKQLDMDPIPFVLSQIASSNLGGSATLMGNPPNVILGTGLGVTLAQYVIYLGPTVILLLILNAYLFYLTNRESFKKAKELNSLYISSIKPFENVKNPYMFYSGLFSFLLTIVLLIVHEKIGITVGHVGIIGATIALLLNGHRVSDIWEKIDWEVIVFFATLFIIIGALEVTGVIQVLAGMIISFAKGSALITKNVLLWVSSILSGFVDNVPFAASMVPLIKSITGKVPVSLMSMGLITTFGTDVGGNLTPIGASPNVVGLSILRNAGIEVSWKEYIKKVAPITLFEILIADVVFILLYH
ncbi:ArsB/NhaD family transporter [Caldisericum exile]|uniref:Transporter n=1 Tax=Caldisericum exile (strain DSM 21853 / NBRC 104410 / AZM16c01) TaxID=511051 RepID=A0A7U6GEM7_CALEA|nr:SLC13 family permease [Caldisericum exile]BAL80994.1 putative transporter [Caldisericum exile AZM16c01]